jgi:hypothetical protein
MKQLHIFDTIDAIKSLPAGNNAINLFMVWKEVFIVIYKDEPIGI